MVIKRQSANYIVSFDTFMLEPIIEGSKISTRVIERNGETIIPKKPIHIVRKSCDFYGGSLQSSTNKARLTLGNHHKTPIIIAHDYGRPYIFLPTLSPRSESNVWVSYHAIDFFESDNNMGSIIHLENTKSIKVDISTLTLYRQYSFAGFLEKNFMHRQRQLSRPSTYDITDN